MKKLYFALLGLLTTILFVGRHIERWINRFAPPPTLSPPSSHAEAVAEAVGVVDLHCDAPLFGKDLTADRGVGHTDFPRLVRGDVRLQVHAVATQIPAGFNPGKTSTNRLDLLSLVYALQLSSMMWMTPYQRALYQARRVRRLVARSKDAFFIEKRPFSLRAEQVGVILAFEGAQAVGDDSKNLDRLFQEGYRIAGLCHFHDNIYAGSAHGEQKGGLTAVGHELVERARSLGMIIDLAHASSQTITDVCQQVQGPLICSHTGLQGHFNSPRNISDADARQIAEVGGLIGIGFWHDAVGSNLPSDIVAAIVYGVKLVGEEHICFGSDFDGAIRPVADTAVLPTLLIDEMLKAGFSEARIEKIIYGNAIRFFEDHLPS